MSYIQENLMPNERILITTGITPTIPILRTAVSFLFTILFFIFSLMFLGSSIRSSDSTQPSIGTIFTSTFGTLLLFTAGISFFATILVFIHGLVLLKTSEFAVTNHRIVTKMGFVSMRTNEMLLHKIESVTIHQNILGRIFNYGSVIIVGTGGTKVSFLAVGDPITTKNKISRIVEVYIKAYRRRVDQNSR